MKDARIMTGEVVRTPEQPVAIPYARDDLGAEAAGGVHAGASQVDAAPNKHTKQ
jgi:hypothetical protein